MMYNYPFSSFPYFRRYSSNSSIYNNSFSNYKRPSNNNVDNYNTKSLNHEKNNLDNKNSNCKSSYGLSFLDNFFNQTDRNENESYFDLFGLKLYNDDIFLIGLIFFLYKEDVKDQYLFIALILLLLS